MIKTRLLFMRMLLTACLISLGGCSLMISSATENFAANLKNAILQQNDPQLVIDAFPAYILIQDALLLENPDDPATLEASAQLYQSYLSLAENMAAMRKQALSAKALNISLHLACVHKAKYCDIQHQEFAVFEQTIQQSSEQDVDVLFLLATNWASWIQARKTDWQAVAQLAQVKTIIKYITQNHEAYKQGEAFVYLGVLESLLPPALGGDPEAAKAGFEQAMKLSNRQNLLIPVYYAKFYARMMFDRELHDRLLNEVVNSQADHQEQVLKNVLAKRQAKALLKSADDYF